MDEIHKQLGDVMWDYVGMSRNAAGLKTAIDKVVALRTQFWSDVSVSGEANFKNSELEKAARVADFLSLAN